jgi:hypothetical protein
MQKLRIAKTVLLDPSSPQWWEWKQETYFLKSRFLSIESYGYPSTISTSSGGACWSVGDCPN